MMRLCEIATELSQDGNYQAFQDRVTGVTRRTLRSAYENGFGEVVTLSNLVNSLNYCCPSYTSPNNNYSVDILSKVIHGNESMVSFQYLNNNAQCELGDMVIITQVVDDTTPLVQRICIIQNKIHIARIDGIEVDRKQLYLLTEFPDIADRSYILGGRGNVRFMNRSGCLGAYGVFVPHNGVYVPHNGMLFMSAKMLTCVLDINKRNNRHNNSNSIKTYKLTIAGESYLHMRSSIFYYPSFHPFLIAPDLNYFNNTLYCYNTDSFIRAWTQVNLGEYTYINNIIYDNSAHLLAGNILDMADLSDYTFPSSTTENTHSNGDNISTPDKKRYDYGDNTRMAIFLLRINMNKDK